MSEIWFEMRGREVWVVKDTKHGLEYSYVTHLDDRDCIVDALNRLIGELNDDF